MKTHTKDVLLIAAILAIIVAIGAMDGNDELAAQKRYCHMVKNGYWPDYQHTYKTECKGK